MFGNFYAASAATSMKDFTAGNTGIMDHRGAVGVAAMMTEFIRTPDENFNDLHDYSFRPNYHGWQDLRMHYLDEGPKDGPVMLLLHGMPSWSYLYRDMIPLLVNAGEVI